MLVSKRLARDMLIGAIIVAALVYLVFGNSLSETEMVLLSYVWVPIATVSGVILIKGKTTIKLAIGWLIASILGLVVFFEVIFPML